MSNRMIAAAGLGLICLAGMQTTVMAGGRGGQGYEPLWWNGPAGYNYTDLFDRRIHARTIHVGVGGCRRYERKYVETGREIWLRKYRVCVIGTH